MSGQMRSYDFSKYMESLENTQMQYPVRVVKIDYSGLVKYARDKGVEPCDLDKDEQEKFVLS
ncbi:MAG: hypothetical protein J6M66_14040 [Lachnospiraceae bacterium]|nr:hypothetical protein [Lachnospiraceae bacterium]